MASKYYLGSVVSDPTQPSKLTDRVTSAFELLEADALRSVWLVDKSGTGPASGANVTLTTPVTAVWGALVQDVSGANVLLWKAGSLFTLDATGLLVTNIATDFNAVGDTFVLFLKPKVTEPS